MKAAITCQVDLMVTANSGQVAQSRLADGLRKLAAQIENDQCDIGAQPWSDDQKLCLGRLNLRYLELDREDETSAEHLIPSGTNLSSMKKAHRTPDRKMTLVSSHRPIAPAD
ncbi:hypothetical protein [Pseudooceanicola onchidii]|uniref:hypothetical protein n=1 Tax=Pseudooceanicola onchidii TaxID=2562279 RepID=UPI0010A9D16C|nr:hypothetical protein [Pseudooceanicola onchidii]